MKMLRWNGSTLLLFVVMLAGAGCQPSDKKGADAQAKADGKKAAEPEAIHDTW